jgi:MFS family permease
MGSEPCLASEETRIAGVNTTQPATEPRRLAAMFRSFRHRDFAVFWSGNLLSNIGTWMQNLALGWLILEMTNSPFLLGLNGFLSMAPTLVFALLGGAIADRLNRRRLMLATQTSMMGLALTLAVLTSSRLISIAEILTISFLTGLATALNHPAYQSLVPDLVEREDLVNAVALNSAQFNISRAVGPTLAGLALGSLGAAVCFYLNSLSFLALIIALLVIKIPARHLGEGPTVWRAIIDGLHFARRHRVVIMLLSIPAVLSFFGLPFIVLMPAYVRDVLGMDATGLGYLMGGAGLGAVISALTLAAQANIRLRGKYILVCAAAFSIALVMLAFANSFAWAFLFLAVIGATMVGALALTNSSLQWLSPPELRGRIMSMYVTAVLGMAPLGNLLGGAVAEVWGVRAVLGLGGAVCLAYFLTLLFLLPRLPRISQLTSPSA